MPAVGESSLVRTYTADLLPAGNWQLGGLFNYVSTPLEGKVNGVEKELSEAQYILTVSGAYALNEKWQLGASFPWLVKQEGELTGVDEAVESAAGDLRLEAKYRFCGGKDQLGYALVPFLTLPTGDDDPARGFFGRPSASAGVIFVADRNWCNHTHVALNLGLQVQEEELDRMTIENTLLFGLGLSRLLSNERTTLALEINGRADDSWFSEAESTPIEILGSLTQQVNESLRLSFGLGSSLNDGYGAPDYRVLVGLKAAF
ncbi:MAG: hypothetical protein BWY73_01412 [candidate division TA06 bacterium ADurb.Bin417]|uniref:Transporter n=1 Tax=candidate division TA06 bacterium ADurb.Bin417 TaxID=1852828 RepID=A0A1V5MAT1_UNCT6|nr:MAG: hypothetical protein BWY73_01412 [candidate division TA06 bacterium ADurb.Bin417]